MAAWQGFVRYDICNRNRQLLVYYLHELVCDVRDSQTHRGDRRARTRTEISSAPTATHAHASPLARDRDFREAEGRGARPAAARRARGTRTDTRRARAPGAGHPEMCDADGEIHLFTCTRGYVTPPPPPPRTATHLGAWGTPPLHTLPLRAHTRRARLRTCSHSNAQRFKPKQLQVCARLSTSLDGSSGPGETRASGVCMHAWTRPVCWPRPLTAGCRRAARSSPSDAARRMRRRPGPWPTRCDATDTRRGPPSSRAASRRRQTPRCAHRQRQGPRWIRRCGR